MNKEFHLTSPPPSAGPASTLVTAVVLVGIGMAAGALLMPAPLALLHDPLGRVLLALAAAALVGALLAHLHLHLAQRRARAGGQRSATAPADLTSRAAMRARERAARLARERVAPAPARRDADLDFLHLGPGHER